MKKIICDRCGKEIPEEYRVTIQQKLVRWEAELCQECADILRKEFKMLYHSGQDKEV